VPQLRDEVPDLGRQGLGRRVKVRCSKCAQVFVVRKDVTAASLESISSIPSAPPAGLPSGPPTASLGPPPGAGVRPGFSPPSDPANRLSGPKDPFAFTGFPPNPAGGLGLPDADLQLEDTPTAAAVQFSGGLGGGTAAPSASGSASLDSDGWADPFASADGLVESAAPDRPFDADLELGPPAAASDDEALRPPPLPRPGDRAHRFSGPEPEPDGPPAFSGPAVAPPSEPSRSFIPALPADPFAEDPFDSASDELSSSSSPFEAPPQPSSDVTSPRPVPAPAPHPPAAPAPAPVALGRIEPMRVRQTSADLPPPEPQVGRAPTPVPELKWPPRVGLVLGLVLAVLWLRPATLDWADGALGGAGGELVRTVDLEARPYALDIDDPRWVVTGKAETRGRAYPKGLDARVRVRAGPTLVADLRVPVGLVPPVPVLADGPGAVEAYWSAQSPPPLGPASRTPFLALLPELSNAPDELTFEVDYDEPAGELEDASAPTGETGEEAPP